MLDDRLDELVDEVAKSMTAAPPDPLLTQRVWRRIAEEGTAREIRWRPWVLVPVASAFVVMLAVFVARENSGKVRPAPTTTDVGRPFQGRQTAGPDVERPFQGRGQRFEARGRRDPERVAIRNPASRRARRRWAL